MKNFIINTILTVLVIITQNAFAQCENGGFEFNDYTNWNTYTGDYTRTKKKINKMKKETVVGRHEIIEIDNPDPFTNFNVNSAVEGQYALKLGSDEIHGVTPGWSQMANYTFKVTNQNKYFKFQYAIVITDWDHPKKKQPFFQYWVTKSNRRIPKRGNSFQRKLYNRTFKKIVADHENPFFKPTGQTINTSAPIIYRDWTCEVIDLSDYVGQELTIHFLSSDCLPSPDWGYVYIDALCEGSKAEVDFTLPEVACKGAEIPLDATATSNEDSWFVSLQESDADGNRYGREVTRWYTAQKAGKIDIQQFAKQNLFPLKCGKYYRVKIAAINKCSGWNEKTKLIRIECPELEFPDDFSVCCISDPDATISIPVTGNIDVHTINATASNGEQVTLDYSTATFTTKYPKETTTYTFEVTTNLGCTYTEEVTVKVKKLLSVNIEHASADVCSGLGYCFDRLAANVREQNCNTLTWEDSDEDVTYSWRHDGSEEKEIELSGSNLDINDFTVSVTNGCYSAVSTIRDVHNTNGPTITGTFPTLFAGNNAMNLNSSSEINRRVTVYDYSVDKDAPSAYNATAYKLYIFNLRSEIVNIVEGCSETGFANGDIFWDGKQSNGDYAPMGVYQYVLYLKNCSHSSFKRMTKYAVYEEDGTECLDYVTAFGVNLWCRLRTTTYKIVETDKYNGINGVTVLRL